MTIDEMKKYQKECLETDNTFEYATVFSDFIKNTVIDDDVIEIIVKSTKLDNCANFFEFFDTLPKEDANNVGENIRKSQYLKKNDGLLTLRFFALFIAEAHMQDGNAYKLYENMVALLIEKIVDDKNNIPEQTYFQIMKENIIDNLSNKSVMPPWEDMKKIKPEIIENYTSILLNIINDKPINCPSYTSWLRRGNKLAKELIEKNRLEAKIPKSRVEELNKLVAHYTEVEKQITDAVYEIDKLEKEIEQLKEENANLYKTKLSLEDKISVLENTIDEQGNTMNKASKEIQEYQQITDSFTVYKQNAEKALLDDIARELQLQIKNYNKTLKLPVSDDLVEMYRDIINTMIRKLKEKGVEVE